MKKAWSIPSRCWTLWISKMATTWPWSRYLRNPKDDMGELVILKAAGEEEDSYLEPIEDEDEFNKVAEIFMDRLKDTFEFED